MRSVIPSIETSGNVNLGYEYEPIHLRDDQVVRTRFVDELSFLFYEIQRLLVRASPSPFPADFSLIPRPVLVRLPFSCPRIRLLFLFFLTIVFYTSSLYPTSNSSSQGSTPPKLP
jgi:hypothetical protein